RENPPPMSTRPTHATYNEHEDLPMTQRLDSIAQNLGVNVANGAPIADLSKLEPLSIQRDQERHLQVAVERVQAINRASQHVRVAPIPNEMDALYTSIE